jgi:hypothetical protein
MTSKWGRSHERMIDHALLVKPGMGEPAFMVKIVTTYRGQGRILQWGDVPSYDKQHFPDFKVLGTYLAYPIAVHDGGRLLEFQKETTIPTHVLEDVLEAFRSGVIKEGTIEAIKRALIGIPT